VVNPFGKKEKNMPCRLALLFSVLIVSPAFGQRVISNSQANKNRLTVDDVVEKNGVILSLKHVGNGRMKMKFQADDSQEYTLDWKTLIYKLTERNRQIYKEQDKLADIVADVNKLSRRVKDLPEKERDLIIDSWANVHIHSWAGRGVSASSRRVTAGHAGAATGVDISWDNPAIRRAAKGLSQAQMDYWRDEEDRRTMYGPCVRLVPQMMALVVADKGHDATYAVLVTGKKEEPKKEKTAESPGKEREAEAARMLKYARQTLKDAEAAKGDERDRLSEIAQKKLQEVVDKYEGSKAAKEAQDLLDKK
jgi:hypothetical protein